MRGHLHIVVNAHSGVKQSGTILGIAIPVFESAGWQVTRYDPLSAEALQSVIRELPSQDGHALCVVGGDGTLHRAVNTMMERPEHERIAMGVLPGGTGNALMRDRGLLDPRAAAEKIVDDSVTPLDLMKIECDGGVRYAFNLAAFGLMVSANMRAEKLRIFGKRRYDIAAAWEILFHRNYAAALIVEDGEPAVGDYTFIAGLNTIHTGAGMKMAPEAKLSDGMIDLLAVRAMSRRRLFSMLPKVYTGGHMAFPELEYRKVRSFRIESELPRKLNIDGEICGQTPMTVSVMPAAMQLL